LKKPLNYILFFLVFLISISIAYASTEYTPNTMTECTGGRCTKSLYGSTTFVNENGIWKHYTEAKSLKDKGFYIKYIENDTMFNIDVIDFNATDITLDLSTPEINKDVPLRVWEEKKDLDYVKLVKDQEEYLNKTRLGAKTQVSISYKNTSDILKEENVKVRFSTDKIRKTLPFGVDKSIEWGYNSTVIELSTLNSTNLDDSYVNTANPNFNYNYLQYLSTGSDVGANYYSFFRFNISVLPPGLTIVSANLSLYTLAKSPLATDTFYFYNIYSNTKWNESYITFNNNPCGTAFTNTSACNTSAESIGYPYASWVKGTYSNYSITNMVNRTYLNNSRNVSILILEVPGTGNYVTVSTKENSTATPILFITYDIYGGGPITFNANTTANNTIKSQNWIYSSIDIDNTSVISRYNITLYNSSGLVSSYNTTYDYNFTSLANGLYHLNASFTVLSNATNVSPTYNITLDTYNPKVSYNTNNPSTSNTSTYNSSQLVIFDFNITDLLIRNPINLYSNLTCKNDLNTIEYTDIRNNNLNHTMNLTGILGYDFTRNNGSNIFSSSYNTTCIDYCPTFTPFGASIDGVIGRLNTSYYLTLANGTNATLYERILPVNNFTSWWGFGTGFSGSDGFYIWYYQNQRVIKCYAQNSSGIGNYAGNYTSFGDNKYLDIVCTLQNGINLSLYINGVWNGSTNITGGIMPKSSYIYLGPYLNGTREKALYYDRVLSNSEISSLSNSTRTNNIILNYSFTNSGNKTCMLNVTDDANNSNVSYFRFGVNDTTYVDLHAYNLWNGSTITVFNASVEGTIYNTSNGSIYLMFTPAEKDIMVFAPTYNNTFNFTTSAVGSNYTYNVSFYQSTLTISPRTAAGNISLTSMSISVSNGSVTNTTSNPSGPITFYVNNATYLVSVSVPNGLYFSNSSYFNASGFGTNYTYYVYMSSASYNLSLIDEKTNLAFNISSPDMLTFYVYCDDSYVSITNITNSTFAIPVGCDFDKIKVIVSYPTTVYHRTLLFPRSFNSSLSTIPIYLVDLDTTSIVLDNFQIFTLLNTMQNVKIYFTKNIGANQYVITSNDINLVQSMAAYLMLGEEYTILIEADGIAAYSLGTFTADSSGDRLLRLFEINMSGTPSGAWTDTLWWMSTDNSTTPPRLKIIYNSTNVSIATMNIYNNTLDDTLLYTTSLVSDNGIFYYPPPTAYENYTFFVNLNITKDSGEVITFKNSWNTKNSKELEAIAEGFISKTQLNTFLALVLAVVALTFDITTASIGGFVIIGFAALFMWLKWYSIAAVTFGLAILITVVDFFKKKDNQGGP